MWLLRFLPLLHLLLNQSGRCSDEKNWRETLLIQTTHMHSPVQGSPQLADSGVVSDGDDGSSLRKEITLINYVTKEQLRNRKMLKHMFRKVKTTKQKMSGKKDPSKKLKPAANSLGNEGLNAAEQQSQGENFNTAKDGGTNSNTDEVREMKQLDPEEENSEIVEDPNKHSDTEEVDSSNPAKPGNSWGRSRSIAGTHDPKAEKKLDLSIFRTVSRKLTRLSDEIDRSKSLKKWMTRSGSSGGSRHQSHNDSAEASVENPLETEESRRCKRKRKKSKCIIQ